MMQMTEKELAAVSDQLTQEHSLIQKYEMYAQMSTDPQICTQCEEFAAKHRNHYQTLLQLLG